jgi:hypothetical protein
MNAYFILAVDKVIAKSKCVPHVDQNEVLLTPSSLKSHKFVMPSNNTNAPLDSVHSYFRLSEN